MPSEAWATATLLKRFDDLFDALNANTQDLRRGKKFDIAWSSFELFPWNEEFYKRNAICFKQEAGGLLVETNCIFCNLTAMERLWNNLNIAGIQSLSTRRVNQDPLEIFFGCVRYNCGSNYNPTISQFVAGFKTAIIANLRHSSPQKNCEEDDGILSNNLKTFLMAPSQDEGIRDLDFGDDDFPDTPEEISWSLCLCMRVHC